MNTEDKKAMFQKEFQELLAKYDAAINANPVIRNGRIECEIVIVDLTALKEQQQALQAATEAKVEDTPAPATEN